MARVNTNGMRRRVMSAVGMLAVLFATRGVLADLHTFSFDASKLTPKAEKIYLAGSFNGWNPNGQLMENKGGEGGGVWSATVDLPPGVHFYKFVAEGPGDQRRWINDPKSDKEFEESDGNGGMNSAVLVGPDARKLPKPVANAINPAGVKFDPKVDVNVVDERTLRIGCRAQAGDVENVFVVVAAPMVTRSYLLHKTGTALGYDEFSNVIELSPEAAGKDVKVWLSYKDGDAVADVGTSVRVRKTPTDTSQAMAVSVTMKPTFETPAWTKHAVWYQIFPERFRNGDSSNDPKSKDERPIKWTSNWWETQPGEAPGAHNFYQGEGNVWKRRYGGDIQGLREKLPYLRSLGITAIYLNPIFEATSMHKYDTRDYRHVDDNLTVKETLPLEGETEDPSTWKWSKGDRMFLDFIQEAHKQGFKVVLDGVFNHVGSDHPFFLDVVKNGRASKYADWFEIESFPDSLPAKESEFGKPGGLNYKAWDKPSGALPAFKKDPKTGLAKGPYEHVMAITKRWLAPDGDPSKGIDGWRLDVANDIPHPFWIEWRKLVKSTKPDAYISGEIWSPAQPWLKGDQFDAVMNYQFAMPAQRFFVNQKDATSPSVFSKELNKVVGMYPLQASLSMMNLYDSHDTDRLASMFVNPDRNYDSRNRIQDNDPTYSPAKPNKEQWARFKQAVEFQMFFLGSPMVYYGSEAGMWSPDDPSNRMPMVWKDLEPYDDKDVKFNPEIFATYQRAIAVRQALQTLQTGYVRTVSTDDKDGTLVIARELGETTVYVAVNRSAQKNVVFIKTGKAKFGEGWVNWMDPQNVEIDASGMRPVAKLKPRPVHENGDETIALTMKPWETAVLTYRDRPVADGR